MGSIQVTEVDLKDTVQFNLFLLCSSLCDVAKFIFKPLTICYILHHFMHLSCKQGKKKYFFNISTCIKFLSKFLKSITI